MSDSTFDAGFFLQAPLFAALGDETRLSLVARLCRRGHQSISQLTRGTELTRQAVTKHLHVLERVGLVKSAHNGRQTFYELDAAPIETMTEYLELVAAQWDKKLANLKGFLGE